MLISCPGCGKRVSDRAPKCPFCSQPLKAPPESSAQVEEVQPPPKVAAPPAPLPVAFAPPVLPGRYARGDAIGDGYRVEKVLGEGGFGIVYLVHARRGGGRVALKTIRDEWLRDDATRAMFRKEAELWIALGRHPYLVRADFVDEEHGRLFLVMEYVPPDARGMTGLEDRLERDPPDLDKALRYAVQFCYGMEYAYARGIRCHRDIKPANILIGADGAVRITDFGIAGVVAAGAESPPAAQVQGMGGTVAGAVFGTPTHMPPEQFVDAASCDERSDIYSFGVVLYQMASRGALPFLPQVVPGPDARRRFFAELRRLHESAAPAPLDSPLMPVIARCLQKERVQRYPGFAALRTDLARLLLERTGETVAVPLSEGASADDLCQRGISLASLGRHAEALACYDQALGLRPDEAVLHGNRGNALSHLGRLDEALLAFDRAIELRPRHAGAFANRAIAYARAGRFVEALRDVDLALGLNARSSEAWQARGIALSGLGRRDESIAAYDAALKIDARDPLSWGNKAGQLLETGRHAEAIDCYDRALALDPRASARWVGKATALAQLGRHDDALPCFDEALRLDPRDPQAHYNKGNSLVQLGRYEDAASCFVEANRLAPRVAVVWYNRAICELVLQQPGKAGDSLRRYLSLSPAQDDLVDEARALLRGIESGELTGLARGKGPPRPGDLRSSEELQDTAAVSSGAARPSVPSPGARPPLAAAAPQPQAPPPSGAPSATAPQSHVEAPPPLPPARVRARPPLGPTVRDLNNEGDGHFRAGRYPEALASFERALEHDPFGAVALGNRANALFKLGRVDEAIASHERALACDPFFLPSWASKAAIEQMSGRRAAALGSYREVVAQADTRDETARADAHAKAQRLEQAGVTAPPRSALGWLGAGARLGAANRFAEAIGALDRALAQAPHLAEAWLMKAEALRQLGQTSEAVALTEEALRQRPADPLLWHARGIDLKNQDRQDEALACFDRALALEPRHAASWSDRGRALGVLKRLDEGIESLERAIALRPDSAPPWLNKALAEEEACRPADAVHSFRMFLERAAPEHRLQAEMAKDRLAILEPLLGDLVRTTAPPPTQAATPRPEEALESLEQALAADPRAPLPRFHMAEVLEQLGRRDDAAKAYQQFLGVASPAVLPSQTQAARKRLAELRGNRG